MNTILHSNKTFNQFNQTSSIYNSLQFRYNKKIKIKRPTQLNQANQNQFLSPRKTTLIKHLHTDNTSQCSQNNGSISQQFFTIRKKSRSRSRGFQKQFEGSVFNEKTNQTSKLSFRNQSLSNLLKKETISSQLIKEQNYQNFKTPKKRQSIQEFFSVKDFLKTTKKSQEFKNQKLSFQKEKQLKQKQLQIQKRHFKTNISMVQSIIFNQKKPIQLSDLHIIKNIGKGQYGKVYMAIHKVSYFIFALKVISKEKVKQHKYQEQILRELKIHSNLDHPNIIPMYGFFSDEKNVYVLMEYCMDKNLNNFNQSKQCMRMEENEISSISLQITEGLQYLHRRNIIHRDIKPQNIMLTYGVPKICDFGWSIQKNQTDLTKTRSGTPLYYSPQVVKGEYYDNKVDIWALGMIIYQCLVGKTPFKVYTQNELNRIVDDILTFPSYVQINKETKKIVSFLLQKDPKKRISLQEFRNSQFIKKHIKKDHEQKYYLDLFFSLRQ